jgi:glycosyltransferase involved in cell wall biosynthesis/peptidoglycan biosynthesis protein MviN/MurJ (putative lipid II flippase)
MNRPAVPTRQARAGMAVAVATLAMAAASGVQAVAYLSSFGTTDRTDAFFAAFALYTVFGVFCQSIRVTSVPLLVGPDRAMRGREYAATLALIALPVAIVCFALAVPVAGLLAPGVSPAARETTEAALRILGPAMILQLGAAGEATLLGIWDRFDIVAQGYIAGAVAGVVSFFIAVGPADELALGWSMLAMAVVTAGWMTAGLARARTVRRPGHLPKTRRLARDAGRILGRTLVYFVINGLFLITLAYVSRASAGDATVLSYAYLFVSYLVAGTGVAVGISRVPDMARGAKADWDDVVADTVPHGFRYAMMASAPAVAALVAAGAPLVSDLVPSGLPPENAETLALFAALLAPWLAGALLVNFALPALFALGRERLVNGLAVPLIVLHVAVTALGDAVWGAEGAVAAMCVAPIVFGSVLLAVGAGARRRSAAVQLLQDAITFLGLAAGSFGAAWLAASPLDDGVVRNVLVIAVGSLLYVGALLLVAPRQIEVFVRALAGGGASDHAPPTAEPSQLGYDAATDARSASGLRVLVLATYFPKPDNMLMGTWALAQSFALARQGAAVRVVSPTSWVPQWVARLPGAKRLRPWACCPISIDLEDVRVDYPRWPWYGHSGYRAALARRRPGVFLALAWPFVRRSLLRTVAEHRPDVVFAHHASISGELARRLQRACGLPYLVIEHDHGEITDCERFPRRRALYEKVLKGASAVVAVAPTMREEIKSLFPDARVVVAYNGADPPDERALTNPRPAETRDRLVVFSAAHLYYRKGMPLLVEAFARIADNHPQAVLRIAGEGEDRPALEAAIEASGVSERISLLGRMPHRRVLQELAWADVFALIGWDEPLAVAFLEAMAAGTPVLACNDGGFAHVVADGKEALLVPPRDVEAAADALDRMLGDDELRRNMGITAARLAATSYTWDANARTLLAAFEHAVGPVKLRRLGLDPTPKDVVPIP